MDEDLPPGWERRETRDHKVYYVNHNNRTTHWKRPTNITSNQNQNQSSEASSSSNSSAIPKLSERTSASNLSSSSLPSRDLNRSQSDDLPDSRQGAVGTSASPATPSKSGREASRRDSSADDSAGKSSEPRRRRRSSRKEENDDEPLPDGWELRYDIYDRYLMSCNQFLYLAPQFSKISGTFFCNHSKLFVFIIV